MMKTPFLSLSSLLLSFFQGEGMNIPAAEGMEYLASNPCEIFTTAKSIPQSLALSTLVTMEMLKALRFVGVRVYLCVGVCVRACECCPNTRRNGKDLRPSAMGGRRIGIGALVLCR